MGYSTLVITIVADGNWNPKSNDFVMNQAAVSVADIGNIQIKGTLRKFTSSGAGPGIGDKFDVTATAE